MKKQKRNYAVFVYGDHTSIHITDEQGKFLMHVRGKVLNPVEKSISRYYDKVLRRRLLHPEQ